MSEETPPDDAGDLRALLDAIETHPGMLARRSWDALRLVHMAFVGNQGQLLRMVEAIEANEGDIGYTMAGNMTPEDARRNLFAELFRLLHNYVTSAVTLVDHTRNLTKGYEGTPTALEYGERIAAIRAGGLGPFVARLRVYVVHVGVPAIGTGIHVENGQNGQTVTITSFIDRDQALKWPDWSPDARRYLEEQAKQIPLRGVVTAYGQVVEELYRWFYDQFPVLHRDDIAAVNELISRTPGGGLPPG